MSLPRLAVIQFPGSNCEAETARAIRAANLEAGIFRWNDDPARLAGFDGYVIGGGFSYQDRVRAGAIAAKEPVLDALAQAAQAGKPVLGICNGAQVLVEAGLAPGLEPGRVEMALAANVMQREGHTVRRDYYCNWAYLRLAAPPERCAFTLALAPGELLPMPFAHAEGRFVTRDESALETIARDNHIVFQYATPDGNVDAAFPTNPNGAQQAMAGLCNRQGNVLALMPHPERASLLRMVPATLAGPHGDARRAAAGNRAMQEGPGPGSAIFRSLAMYLS